MPLDVQVRLLRILETTRSGASGEPRHPGGRADGLRLQPDLERCTRTGPSEDLFHRINLLPIDLPPLRDRGGDVELLAEHFLVPTAAGNSPATRGPPCSRTAGPQRA